METKSFSGRLSTDIKLNIRKLEHIISKYSKADDEEKKKLIIDASFLIEKIIFYIQLEEGVEKVATYTYEDKKIEEITNPLLLLKFNNGKYDIRNFFLLREYIVKEYKKYKKRIR